VGDPPLFIDKSNVLVTAPVSGSNVLPILETETKLYQWVSPASPAVVIDGKFFSQTGTDDCIINLNASTKSFYVYCTDITQYLYPGAASKTFNMRFTTSYTQIGGCPASPTPINDNFTVTIYNFCGRDKLTALSATSAK